MVRTRLAARGAAVALLLLGLPAPLARAYTLELPGERKAEIVGFYEMRVRAFGEDLPANGMSLSQFRHVLNLETDIDIFPDGAGPFDTMVGYTRWIISYDCVYTRACGLFDSADSYGGENRSVGRQPQSFRTPRNAVPFAGGVFPLFYRAGSLRSSREAVTGSRYETIINPDGDFTNPFPLAALANLNTRTLLDQPIDGGTSGSIRVDTRAGYFNPGDQFVNAQLTNLRSSLFGITGIGFSQLRAAPKLSLQEYGLVTGEASRATRLENSAQLASRYGIETAESLPSDPSFDPDDPNLPPTLQDALRDSALQRLFGTADPSNPTSVPDTINAFFAQPYFLGTPQGARLTNLVLGRPDPNKFLSLALANEPDLLTMKWGATSRADGTWLAWIATLNTHMRPLGYFGSRGSDTINELGTEVAMSAFVPGGGEIFVDGSQRSAYCLQIDPAAPCISPTDAAQGDLQNRRAAIFFGPDGLLNTADDLPILRGSDTHPLYLTDDNAADQEKLSILRGLNLIGFAPVDPNGTIHLSQVVEDPVCQAITGRGTKQVRNSAGECVECLGDGFNARGECVLLTAGGGKNRLAAVDPEALDNQADPALRPGTAILEPTDAIDLLANRDGQFIPARPSKSGRQTTGVAEFISPASPRGLYFTTQGAARAIRRAHNLVGNLDLEFTEDELTWEHGGSQDEHEFREGYVEFEMLDSELFARVGKLLWVWGKTELFRNQDRLNPVDLGLGALARLEEARIAQWGTQFVYSPEAWMQVGPIEDMRIELVTIFDDFEPTDLGECGEGSTFEPVCALNLGAMASGLAGLGVLGEVRPNDENENTLQNLEWGMRLEGRWDRFTFAVTDYWGYDDGILLELAHQYQRRVDPETGAPVSIYGPLQCKIREDANGVRVGPDGVAGPNPATRFNDDLTPSVGNCLLFEPDPDNPGRDRLRASDDIALNHYANQTLFHSICTLTFDEDTGYCALDTLNAPALFAAIANIFAGNPSLATAAILGTGTIRTNDARFKIPGGAQRDEFFTSDAFAPTLAKDALGQSELSALDARQRALLGCGPGFFTGCGQGDTTATKGGGVDFMNADASVLTQEFTALKVGSVGALIGTRNGEFEAGITRPIGFTPQEAASPAAFKSLEDIEVDLDPDDPNDAPLPLQVREGAHREASNRIVAAGGAFELSARPSDPNAPHPGAFQQDGITPNHANLPGEEQTPPIDFQLALLDQQVDPNGNPLYLDRVPTDFQVEGMRWLPDDTEADGTPNWFKQGLIVFQDPRVDPNVPSTSALLDPKHTNPLGENCSALYGGPEPGCTDLEIVSADLERFLIANEIIGNDDVFDPPESFAEILGIFDLNPANDTFADPISGPDGIYFNNFDLNEDGIADRKAVEVSPLGLNSFQFVNHFDDDPDDPNDLFCAGTSRFCFQQLGTTATGTPLAHAMPIGLPGFRFNTDTNAWQPFMIPTDRLDRLDLQHLLSFKNLGFNFDNIPGGSESGGEVTVLLDLDNDGQLEQVRIGAREGIITGILPGDTGVAPVSADLNEDRIFDLDENRDQILDSVDDGTPGPITDDNILCGSGVPGDRLQEAVQAEYANSKDALLAREHFGFKTTTGLPPRSPVFCAGASGLLGVTGQTLKYKRSGGDGRFGRRDFLWHGGRQVVLDFQKNNVLGFSLDFAEDRTKSSWGLEFSWQAHKEIGDTLAYDGLHPTNEYLLTISVDRPTFFNFLNPNRSFFLNFQANFRYLSDYSGSPGEKNGSFGYSEGSFVSTIVVFTFFTGYFQDRLNPVFNFVADPGTGTGAILSQVGYRWSEKFSTAVRLNHFFGHPTEVEGSYFPIALYTHPDVTSESTRGLSVVKNQDAAFVTIRYTF